jgi:hypothetical protein
MPPPVAAPIPLLVYMASMFAIIGACRTDPRFRWLRRHLSLSALGATGASCSGASGLVGRRRTTRAGRRDAWPAGSNCAAACFKSAIRESTQRQRPIISNTYFKIPQSPANVYSSSRRAASRERFRGARLVVTGALIAVMPTRCVYA